MTCYLLVTSPTMSWLSAHDACASRGDMLTVLEPVEKAKFISEHVKTNDVYQQTLYFSIGARRPQNAWNTTLPSTGPDYIWLDGQPVNYTATAPFWIAGKPNNYGATENVMALRRDESFLWEDGSENMLCGYICERPLFD
ncbi:C-type lectin domain family 4 member K-like [Littorina saxatilis]|uniref:C-type lectin domain family 4 member K-like n=1 Tax=Littorina saxatilis TaxID=31220 RepID=UPI0038B45B51